MSIQRIKRGRGPVGIVSTLWYQSLARWRFHKDCVRAFLRTNCARVSLYQFWLLVPRARTFALIFTEWLCFLLTRRTTVLFHRSRYLRFVKTAVLPSNSTFSGRRMEAPRRYESITNCRTALLAVPRDISVSNLWN